LKDLDWFETPQGKAFEEVTTHCIPPQLGISVTDQLCPQYFRIVTGVGTSDFDIPKPL
jgi:hypothetical protein